MKNVVKLNEGDLKRIVKRVINEGAGFTKYYTSSDGSKLNVFCTQGGNGRYSTIQKDGKSVNLTDEQYAILCGNTSPQQ